MNKNILFIGLDVHKESIEIAIADGASQEVRRYGKIGGTQDAMLVQKSVRQGAMRYAYCTLRVEILLRLTALVIRLFKTAVLYFFAHGGSLV